MNLILCGLPSCGKTTTARLLGQLVGWKNIDTDQLIEEIYALESGKKLSCREIFRQHGEAHFRAIEKRQIALMATEHRSVISVGGGSFDDPDNRTLLRSMGQIVYLQIDPKLLWKRYSQELPAYLDKNDPESSFYALAKKRRPIYESSSHKTVNINNLSEQEVLDAIKFIWQNL